MTRSPDQSNRRAAGPHRVGILAAVVVAACAVAVLLSLGGARALSGIGIRPAKPPVLEAAVPAHVRPAAGTAVAALEWGSGEGQVGRSIPEEGLPRGPEDLAAAPDGRLVVLDSVNGRLVLLTPEGSFLRHVPISLTSPRFVASDAEQIAVVDADADQKAEIYDWSGRLIREQNLRLPPLEARSSPVTEVFLADGELVVETGHENVFVLWEDGSSPSAVPGRPLNGRLEEFAQARFAEGKPFVELSKGAPARNGGKDGEPEPQAEVRYQAGDALEYLISVDGDRAGGLIVGALTSDGRILLTHAPGLARTLGGSKKAPETPVRLNALYLDPGDYAFTGDPYAVGANGTAYEPQATESGYTIRAHTLTGGGPAR